MTDIRTISPDELTVLSEIPEDLHAVVFSPTGPLQAVPYEKLLTKLIAANLAKATKAALDADLAHPENAVALVFNDATAANNGWYRKLAASGGGSWSQFEELVRSSRILAQAAAAAAAASAASAVNAPGTSATSSTLVAMGTGSRTLLIQTGKAFVVGQFVTVARTSTPLNVMAGQITAHNPMTGSLTVNVTTVIGAGTFSDWTVAISGPPGSLASEVAAAAASAAAAQDARVAAETARDQTLTAYDQFDDRYLGAKAANPALDNDGNALVGGALHFNTTAGEMRLWTGSAWVGAYASGAGFVAKSGDTLTGKLVTAAPTASVAGLALPHGTAPAAPANGDVWSTTAGLFARINGVSQQLAPLASPAFTGNPTGPTPAARDNDTSLATSAFVQSELMPSVQSLASDVAVTPDGNPSGDDGVVITALAANLVINAPSGAPVQMKPLIFRIKDNGTIRTLTWNAAYRAVGVALPTATAASKTLYVGFLYNATDGVWDCVLVRQQA